MIEIVPRRKMHYAEIVAAAAFLTMMCAAGVRSVPGVLIIPLDREFGWSTAGISLAVSINLLLYGLCGPFAASVMERIGIRCRMVGARPASSELNRRWRRRERESDRDLPGARADCRGGLPPEPG